MPSMEQSNKTLETAYRRIKEFYPNVDSYDVVREVDKYRNYWRPTRTNVVLLAESHVFTSDEDSKVRIDYSHYKDLIPDYPEGYVKFVYCFGYAEHTLLREVPHGMKLRSGTPQFWKILALCTSKGRKFDLDSIKKTTTETDERIRNKIHLLNELKERRGVWLVDGSIVGLYHTAVEKPPTKIMEKILQISWDNCVKSLVQGAEPRYMMCIGKFVYDTLNTRITETGIKFDYIYQPQSRLTSEEREKQYANLETICSEYCQ